MMGHTNRSTINQRRPMSAGMRDLLLQLARAPLPWSDLGEADKNRLRGLLDRGYADCSPAQVHSITEAGRAALEPRP